MELFIEALSWIFSAERLQGANTLPDRVVEHLTFTAIAVVIASVIAIPSGYLIGHTGKGREIAVAISGAARALPSFGLILLLVLMVGVVRVSLAAIIAFVLLAIPSILAGAYTGIQAIDRQIVDAARAVGMTEWQILYKVEIPLGLPLLIGGLRSAVLQVVATVTLAAYVGLGGLGYDIIQGLNLRRYDQMLGSAIVVIVLALVLDALFGVLQSLVIPRGVTAGTHTEVRSAPSRRRPVVGTPINAERG
ncbi:MAG TPA: ABC transporter permease [Homoserinimonas sp.]|nr:ABC transporter permease [Homoserinimonas sp.]